MRFTPSITAFHTMQLAWNEGQNRLTITVSDGDGIADPFVYIWTPDPAFDPTGRIGFTYHNGGGDPGIAFFDNLSVVPEPSTGLLIAFGLALVGGARRRRSS